MRNARPRRKMETQAMLTIEVPGLGGLELEHMVADYNGTLACDGVLLDGVPERIAALADILHVHVVTADTFGLAQRQLDGLPCRLTVLDASNQDQAKLDYVRRLGAASVACIGNGRNDRLMVREAALGIAVALGEGAAVETLVQADVVCTDACAALDLLLHPRRLVATLRS